jgi:hypothetical protein
MSSKYSENDTHELLRGMDDEELGSFATILESDSDNSESAQGSKTMLHAVRHALFLRTKTSEGLDQVIKAVEQALPTTSHVPETRAQMLEEASGLLSTKFERTLAGEDLACAISYIQESIEITPQNSTHFVPRMNCLAGLLDRQDTYTHTMAERNEEVGDPIWSNLDKIIMTRQSDSTYPKDQRT